MENIDDRIHNLEIDILTYHHLAMSNNLYEKCMAEHYEKESQKALDELLRLKDDS